MRSRSRRTTVAVGGRELTVSNLDKVLYPGAGFTKAHVIEYYVAVSDVILAHLRGRPLTMRRYPDGVRGQAFFEKRCPDHRPAWVDTVRLGRPDSDDTVVEHCDVADLPSLVWVANLAALELHTSLAAAPDTAAPTAVVFDLDPGEPADVLDCARVAGWLREVFDRLGLVACPKTSGSKGLQVYVPVNRPVTYGRTRDFALAVARVLERAHGDTVVTNMRRDLRRGRVLIDWSQNHRVKTTVCAYSLRAGSRPTVSTPVTWEEVDGALQAADPAALDFEAGEVRTRVGERGDLFAPVLEVEQALPELG